MAVDLLLSINVPHGRCLFLENVLYAIIHHSNWFLTVDKIRKMITVLLTCTDKSDTLILCSCSLPSSELCLTVSFLPHSLLTESCFLGNKTEVNQSLGLLFIASFWLQWFGMQKSSILPSLCKMLFPSLFVVAYWIQRVSSFGCTGNVTKRKDPPWKEWKSSLFIFSSCIFLGKIVVTSILLPFILAVCYFPLLIVILLVSFVPMEEINNISDFFLLHFTDFCTKLDYEAASRMRDKSMHIYYMYFSFRAFFWARGVLCIYVGQLLMQISSIALCGLVLIYETFVWQAKHWDTFYEFYRNTTDNK